MYCNDKMLKLIGAWLFFTEKNYMFIIEDIKKMDISILLDNFGVKYSNFILSEISFDSLKLDKTMVKTLGENTTN